MCLHHENTQMYRMADETCGLWKVDEKAARQWLGVEDGPVAVSSPVDDEALMEKRFFSAIGSSRDELERQALFIARPYIEAEREECAAMLDLEAERARSQMHSAMTVMEIDRTHRRSIVFIEAADMIRGRK
jgi:hypothetical protein